MKRARKVKQSHFSSPRDVHYTYNTPFVPIRCLSHLFLKTDSNFTTLPRIPLLHCLDTALIMSEMNPPWSNLNTLHLAAHRSNRENTFTSYSWQIISHTGRPSWRSFSLPFSKINNPSTVNIFPYTMLNFQSSWKLSCFQLIHLNTQHSNIRPWKFYVG